MMLHHLTALALTYCSFLCNSLTLGMMVLIVHDFSDIFTSFMRVSAETRYYNSYPSVVGYFLMMTSWTWMRLLAFPIIIWEYSVYGKVGGPNYEHNEYRFFFTGYLGLLFLMHMYWTPILMSVLIHYLKTGKGEDMQNYTIRDPNKEGLESKKAK